MIFEEVRTTPRYAEAFPDLEARFEATLERLEEEPARVTIQHPKTKADVEIVLDRKAFAEAFRLQLYSIPSNRRLPLLLQKAYDGDFRELAQAALQSHRNVRGVIAWGMLMCVTKSEDLSRVDRSEIEEACAGTFLGDERIRTQMDVADIWPAGTVPESFAEPVSVDVPVLLLSGTHDPSTSPRADEAASHLPNGVHVVMPGGHGVFGPEIDRVQRTFLERGSGEGLDLPEVEALKLPPLVLPGSAKK